MQKILDSKPEASYPGDLGIDKRIIKKEVLGCGLDSSISGRDPMTDCCEHGNESLGNIKGRELLDQLHD